MNWLYPTGVIRVLDYSTWLRMKGYLIAIVKADAWGCRFQAMQRNRRLMLGIHHYNRRPWEYRMVQFQLMISALAMRTQ